MAIIYTYPNLPLSSLSAEDLLVITNVDPTNNNPTRSVTLADIATYVTGTGSGTGTTNKIVKFTDGANGLLGDSIMNEDVDKIYVDGQLRIGSSSGASRIQIFHDVLNSDTTFSSGGATGSQIIGRRNELYIENRGASRGDIIFKANNGENNGSADTYFLLDASMADIGNSSRYTRWPDNSRIVLGNSSNVNSLNFEMYYDSGTSFYNDQSTFGMYSKGGFIIENQSGGSSNIEIIQSVADADIEIKGSNGTYFKADTSAGATIFSLPVEVPLIPAANANAASKQYVDQQISSVASGLVFQSTWDASSTPGGNPDLTAADKKVVGHYYVVSVAGSATPNGAGTLPNSWNVGDWCIYVEQGATDRWEKLDQTFVSGAGASGQVTYWNSQNEVAGDNDLFFDSTNKRLGIGTTSPATVLDVNGGLNADHATFSGQAGRGLQISTKNVTNNDDGVVYNAQTSTGEHLFYTNGTEKMRITSAGNVGIGTTSPAYKLTIEENAATDAVRILNIDSNGGGLSVYAANGGGGANRILTLGDSGLNIKVAVVESGNVGIGTATPTAKLEINVDDDGTTDLNALVLKRTWSTATATDRSHGVLFSDFNSSMATIYADRTNSAANFNSDLLFATNTGTNGSSLSTKMIIKNTGNVGIGTTSPSRPLHVNAGSLNFVAEFQSTDDKASIIIQDDDTLNYIHSQDGYLSLGGQALLSASNLNIRSSDGNVGIGTTSPSQILTVRKDSTTTYSTPTTGQNTGDIVLQNNNQTVNNFNRISFQTNSDNNQTGDLLDAARITAIYPDHVGANPSGELAFETKENAGDMNEAMRINKDGNVGIGTSSPLNMLDIYNASDDATLRLQANANANSTVIKFRNDNADADITFDYTSSNNGKMVFTTDNVSGYTPVMSFEEDRNTIVYGDLSIQNSKAPTVGSILNLRRDDTSVVSGDDLGSIFFQGNDPSNPFKSGAAIIGEGDGTWNMGNPNVYPSRLLFQTAKQDALITAMRISSDQNVGIGTPSNPGAKLEIANATEGAYLIAGGDNASNSRALAFTSSTSGVTNGALHTINAQSGNGIIALATAGAEKMRVDNAGNVLFGTTSETNSHAYFSAESNSRMVLTLGAATTSASTIASFKNSNGAVGSISVGGSATSFNTSSDYRLKKDLKDFDGLDKVSKIPVYDFKWKIDDSSSYGVMAHELQEVLPDAVSGEKDGEEMQGVDYSKIVPLLIKSIQELEAKVKILENK